MGPIPSLLPTSSPRGLLGPQLCFQPPLPHVAALRHWCWATPPGLPGLPPRALSRGLLHLTTNSVSAAHERSACAVPHSTCRQPLEASMICDACLPSLSLSFSELCLLQSLPRPLALDSYAFLTPSSVHLAPCTCLPAAPHACQARARPRACALAAVCMTAFSRRPFSVCSLTCSRPFPFRVEVGNEMHPRYLNERGGRVQGWWHPQEQLQGGVHP